MEIWLKIKPAGVSTGLLPERLVKTLHETMKYKVFFKIRCNILINERKWGCLF